MSTSTQQNASRRNGAKSLGPVTPEGKARSAVNATKHGLSGGPVVLPTESRDDYDNLARSYYETYNPATPLERDLVLEMVTSRWRLRRLEAMETALMNQAFDRQVEALGPGGDPGAAMSLALAELAESSKGLRMLDRYQRTLRRSYEKALSELLDLQISRMNAAAEAEAQALVESIQNEPEPADDYPDFDEDSRDIIDPWDAEKPPSPSPRR